MSIVSKAVDAVRSIAGGKKPEDPAVLAEQLSAAEARLASLERLAAEAQAQSAQAFADELEGKGPAPDPSEILKLQALIPGARMNVERLTEHLKQARAAAKQADLSALVEKVKAYRAERTRAASAAVAHLMAAWHVCRGLNLGVGVTGLPAELAIAGADVQPTPASDDVRAAATALTAAVGEAEAMRLVGAIMPDVTYVGFGSVLAEVKARMRQAGDALKKSTGVDVTAEAERIAAERAAAPERERLRQAADQLHRRRWLEECVALGRKLAEGITNQEQYSLAQNAALVIQEHGGAHPSGLLRAIHAYEQREREAVRQPTWRVQRSVLAAAIGLTLDPVLTA